MAYLLLILALSSWFPSAFASSCCGQSPASYSILSMNQRLSVSSGMSYTRSYGRYRHFAGGNEGLEVWDDKKREVTSLLLNVAGTVAPRQQMLLNTAIVQGHYSDESGSERSNHLSDTLLGYSYEILPEYAFSYWKPIVYVTGFLNLPTGHSTYEMNLSEGTDVTGHDQWGAGLGLTVKKVYFPWTLTLQGRTLQLFAKTFGDVRVSDFYDSSLALIVNHSSRFWDLQWNGGVTFNHLSERTTERVEGIPLDSSEASQSFSLLAGVQRPVGKNWGAGISYSDQTLLGPAKNSILNRSINLNLNYNYF